MGGDRSVLWVAWVAAAIGLWVATDRMGVGDVRNDVLAECRAGLQDLDAADTECRVRARAVGPLLVWVDEERVVRRSESSLTGGGAKGHVHLWWVEGQTRVFPLGDAATPND